MNSVRRALVVAIAFPAAAVFSPTTGQDQLSDLKSEWRAQKYREVLRPLLDYRDSLGDAGDFEVDYMIGTSLCHLSNLRSDGINYLRHLPAAYGGQLVFDRRRVSIPKTINDECGCAGVDSKSDSASGCAGSDSKADSATSNQPANPKAIRDAVKKRLGWIPSLVPEYGVDRPGQDYRSFPLAKPVPQLCRTECARDPDCKAFTYVKPSFQGANAVCWLKNAVPDRNANECCISGVK